MQQYSMPMMSGSRHCRTFARRKQSAASALTQNMPKTLSSTALQAAIKHASIQTAAARTSNAAADRC